MNNDDVFECIKREDEKREKKEQRKKIYIRSAWIGGILLLLALIGGCNVWYWNTEGGQRHIKSWKSNNTGGLVRTVEVYSQDGKLLKKYSGKIDVQNNDFGNKVLFDLDGKRYIFYNAIVITEEQ